jgi:hypothetical protein
MNITTQLEAIYTRHEHAVLPYIGAAFQQPDERDLRVMAIGINAYISAKDWPPKAHWMRDWFEQRKPRFYQRVFKEAAQLAAAVTAPSMMFEGRVFDPQRCLLGTNAVKTYLPEAEGKRAEQLTAEHFAQHDLQWRDELQLLAEAGVAPHVILIFGAPFWEHAWKAFHPEHTSLRAPIAVRSFRAAWGDAPHRLNRITLDLAGRPHDLLLVRLMHPAGRSMMGSARWLVGRSAFRELAGRESTCANDPRRPDARAHAPPQRAPIRRDRSGSPC